MEVQAGGGAVEGVVLRSMDRTKERVKSGQSPDAKKRFRKMVQNKDLVDAAAGSYIRTQKKKGEPLCSQECAEEIGMLLPDTPQLRRSRSRSESVSP